MLTTTQTKAFHQAAVIAGLGLLVMVLTVPFAEFGILPKLFIAEDPAATGRRLQTEGGSLRLAISLYGITLLMDFVVAWALYRFLAPTHRAFSATVALVRVVYTVISLVAVYELVKIVGLSGEDPQAMGQTALALEASFRDIWAFAFWFFAAYLILLGVLCYRSGYIHRWVGVAVIIAGVGYLVDCLKPYMMPEVDTSWLFFTFLGELVLMVWLLVKGWRVELPYAEAH